MEKRMDSTFFCGLKLIRFQMIDKDDDDNDDQPYQNQDKSDKMDEINEGESDCDDAKMLSISSVQ